MKGKGPPAGRGPWELEPGDEEPTGLTAAVREAQLEKAEIDPADRVSIGVRGVPAGFRSVIRDLARKHFVSQSLFARVAFEVGMNHLDREPWIVMLREVYDRASEAALDEGRPSALRRLDRKMRYGFRDPSEYHTTFPASRKTQARISELADVCGIHMSQMAVLAAIRAILTLENNRGYRAALEAEIDSYREYVLQRVSELLLPDVGARSRTAKHENE